MNRTSRKLVLAISIALGTSPLTLQANIELDPGPGNGVVITNMDAQPGFEVPVCYSDGTSGANGELGNCITPPVGPTGATGEAGPTGPQGEAGPTGPMGDMGPTGATGEVGPTGLQGDTGPQGDIGPTGADGIQGPQGDTGPVGPQGDTGPTGADGADGIQGPQGDAGPMGDQGYTGPTGPQGDTGPAGADGADGIQGLPGEAGPKGDQGDTGPAGPQGDTGPAGADGAQGPQGPQGLMGPTGLPGADGADGAQGPQGGMGPPGPQGAQGEMGPAGPPGADSTSGCIGGITEFSGSTSGNVRTSSPSSYTSLVAAEFSPNTSTSNGVATVKCTGTLSDFGVALDGNPGPNNNRSYEFTVVLNGSLTQLGCSIAGTQTSCTDTAGTTSINLVPGDKINVRVHPYGTPTGRKAISITSSFDTLAAITGPIE